VQNPNHNFKKLERRGNKKMAKRIVAVTANKRRATVAVSRLNKKLAERNVKRVAYLTSASYSYVRPRMRKGLKVPKRNYAIAVRNKR